MKYHYLDMNAYKRKKHFEYFSTMAYPYVSVTVNVDITEFLTEIKQEKFSFFLFFAIVQRKQPIQCLNLGRGFRKIKL